MISQAKFNSEFVGCNSVAKKVYEATPMTEAWTVQQIYSEVVRLGISLEHRVVHGALGALAEKGLLKEKPKGSFQREAIRPPAAKPQPTVLEIAMTKAQENVTTLPHKTPAPAATGTALQRLEALEARLTGLADRLQALTVEFTETAGAVTNVLLDLQDEEATSGEELQKLRQLKALLQGLGG